MSASKEQIAAAIRTIAAVASAIKDLGEVPSGHLYARLMDRMSLEGYNKIIGILVKEGLVKLHPSHLLTWTGPK